jgi:hypothetical protein
LLPSLELARNELGRKDVHLDIKTILRVARETGKYALAQRFQWLMSWRAGELPAGNELAGKKVAVASDGGKIRLREFSPQGRKTKKNRKKFKTPWREPRIFIIFVLDENGRIDRNYKPFIDGTMYGPDALMELLAMQLHRLGAAKANTGIFLGDGAEWIWNRIPWVLNQAGLETSAWYFSLDFYHAMEHVSASIAAAFVGDSKDMKSRRQHLRTRLRRLLKMGHIRKVIQCLREISSKAPGVIKGHIAYLELRIPLMNYDALKKKGLPIGSGSVAFGFTRFFLIENPKKSVYY